MRGLRRIGILAIAMLVALLGTALVLPPLWDWSRQRDMMEAFAAAALGRAVRIEGAVSLTLLPEPMLSANRVQVMGGAEGGELQIRSLRLGVALLPLLRGRVVARELVLRGPELRLPWPPVASALSLPAWYAGFAGRIEDGQVTIGPINVRDIQAVLQANPEGSLTVSGRMPLGGAVWQVSARLGQPGRDGLASADITLTGRDRAMGNTLVFSGVFAGAVPGDTTEAPGMRGRLSAHGPDLSQWLPTPSMPFRAEGDVALGGTHWVWREMFLVLGGLPARAELDMAVTPKPRLRASLTAPRLELEAWLPLLRRVDGIGLPTTLDLSVEAATLAGGIVRQLRASASIIEGIVRVADARAILPGDVDVRLSGQMRHDTDGRVLDGRVSLRAQDARAGLRWLAAAAGTAPPNPPAWMLRDVALSANVATAGPNITLSDLDGQLDKTRLHGQASIRRGTRPQIVVSLSGDRLSLESLGAQEIPSLADALEALAGITLDLKLRLQTLTAAGRTIHGAYVDAVAQPEQLLLRRLEGTADGVRLAGSGFFGPKGGVTDGRVEISADDARPVADWLPAAWRGHPDLWMGRMVLRAEATGPVNAMAVQLGLDLGDGRLDAQPIIDLTRGQLAGRLSLRHPNARRLLTELGMLPPGQPGPDLENRWPGEGSLALQTAFGAQEDRLTLDAFDLTAGALRTTGQIEATWRGGSPRLVGRIAADSLPLPWSNRSLEEPLPNIATMPWSGMLQIQANQVLLSGQPLMEKLACAVTLDAGTTQVSACTMRMSGGEARIDASLDAAAHPPRLRVEASMADGQLAEIPRSNAELMFGLRGNRADIGMSLQARGHSPAALLATLSGPVRIRAWDGMWRGFDLDAAGVALGRASERGVAETAAALRDALTGGRTAFRELDMEATLHGHVLTIRSAHSSGAAGQVRAMGALGLFGEDLDLTLSLQPVQTQDPGNDPPPLTLRLNGPAATPGRVIDIDDALRRLVPR